MCVNGHLVIVIRLHTVEIKDFISRMNLDFGENWFVIIQQKFQTYATNVIIALGTTPAFIIQSNGIYSTYEILQEIGKFFKVKTVTWDDMTDPCESYQEVYMVY